MANTLVFVKSEAELSESIHRFNETARQYEDRARKLLRQTKYWVYDADNNIFGPGKFVGFAHMNLPIYGRALQGYKSGAPFHGSRTKAAIERLADASFEADETLCVALRSWGEKLLDTDVFGRTNEDKWRFLTFRGLDHGLLVRTSASTK